MTEDVNRADQKQHFDQKPVNNVQEKGEGRVVVVQHALAVVEDIAVDANAFGLVINEKDDQNHVFYHHQQLVYVDYAFEGGLDRFLLSQSDHRPDVLI